MKKQKSDRPVMMLIDIMGRKWNLRILWELNQETCTFRELQSRCGEISPTIISKRLKELIEVNMVKKNKPVGYQLTSLAEEALELFYPLADWAKKWKKTLK